MTLFSRRLKLLAEVFGNGRPPGVRRPRLVAQKPRTGQKVRLGGDTVAHRKGRMSMKPPLTFFR